MTPPEISAEFPVYEHDTHSYSEYPLIVTAAPESSVAFSVIVMFVPAYFELESKYIVLKFELTVIFEFWYTEFLSYISQPRVILRHDSRFA